MERQVMTTKVWRTSPCRWIWIDTEHYNLRQFTPINDWSWLMLIQTGLLNCVLPSNCDIINYVWLGYFLLLWLGTSFCYGSMSLSIAQRFEIDSHVNCRACSCNYISSVNFIIVATRFPRDKPWNRIISIFHMPKYFRGVPLMLDYIPVLILYYHVFNRITIYTESPF